MHTEITKDSHYNRILLERLNDIVPKIVDAFNPEEIIMYGSYARGDNDIYSDIDLIIIVENINMRFQDRSIKVINIISEEGNDDHDIPINPIVYTVEEFTAMLNNKESFLVSALKESVLLWKKDKNNSVERQLEHNEFESDFKKFIV